MSNLDFKNWLADQRTGDFAVLRYTPEVGDSSSDWDLAVADATEFGRLIKDRWGEPDLRIRRQYVEQWYFPWNQVDLLPILEWNGVEYLCQDRFWNGVATGQDGLPRPRIAHDAFIAWMTGVLWGASFKEKHASLITQAWADDGPELRECLRNAFGTAWADQLIDWICSGNPQSAATHANELRRALIWNAFRRAPGECIWRQITHWHTEFKHHLRPPFPWVAILGPDGSGKSSVIEGLSHILSERRLSIRMIHWSPRLIRKGATVHGAVTDPHSKAPRNLPMSCLKLGLIGCEWWWAWAWNLRHSRAKSKILISDRYYDDLLVDPRRYRFGAPISWARTWFRLLPKPDRVILLVGDAVTIHARKQEVTLPELERQLLGYRNLASNLGDRAILVDCCQPLATVVAAAHKAVALTCRDRSALSLPLVPRQQHSPINLAPPIRSRPSLPLPSQNFDNPPYATPSTRPLRVLVSAYACSPSRGAEANVAWNLVRELSARHDMTVITRSIHKQVIQESSEDWTDRVRWIFFDPPRWMTFWRQGKHGLAPFYLLWHLMARQRAKHWIQALKIDLCHHVTIGTYLMPSPLADLGPPLVFGPVGGGERTPPGLRNHFSWRGHIEEWIRDTVRSRLERHEFLHHWYLRTAWAFAATPATEKSLRRIGLTNISMLPQSANGGDAIERYILSHPKPRTPYRGTLNLVTACRLVHWKAVNLAIGAVAVARTNGLDVSLTILEDGPERESLQSLVAKLGVADRIRFTGRLASLNDVYDAIAQSHGLIHPAVHEAFGQACLESLALGVPVICLNWGGPGMIVDDESGYRIDPADPETTVARLADAIASLAAKLASGHDFAPACIRRAQCFKWSEMAEKIDSVYHQILEPCRVIISASDESQIHKS